MVAEATTATRIVRRTRKASKRGDDPAESSAVDDSCPFNSTRPRPPFSKPNAKNSSAKKKGIKTKSKQTSDVKPTSDCGLNESSDFFADDESGNETPGSEPTTFTPGCGPVEFNPGPGVGSVEFNPGPGVDSVEFNFGAVSGPIELNSGPGPGYVEYYSDASSGLIEFNSGIGAGPIEFNSDGSSGPIEFNCGPGVGPMEFIPSAGPVEVDSGASSGPVQFNPGAGPIEFIPGPLEFTSGPVEFTHRPLPKKIEPEPVSQPEIAPDTDPNADRWPNKPLFPPEHYDSWVFPDFPDPQENIFSIYREFLLPSHLAFLRNIHLRTDRGLVDLDLISPCTPENPCLLDRMTYRDGVCHTCYDYRQLRNFRRYY